jgi:hypothetical protein
MSTDSLSLRLDTDPAAGLGLDEAAADHYLGLAQKGLIVPPGCNGPAVQDDRALDPSRTVALTSGV